MRFIPLCCESYSLILTMNTMVCFPLTHLHTKVRLSKKHVSTTSGERESARPIPENTTGYLGQRVATRCRPVELKDAMTTRIPSFVACGGFSSACGQRWTTRLLPPACFRNNRLRLHDPTDADELAEAYRSCVRFRGRPDVRQRLSQPARAILQTMDMSRSDIM